MTNTRSNQVLASLRTLLGFIIIAGIMVFYTLTAYPNDCLNISIVYNNVAFSDEMELGWGFSCVVRNTGRTILFDTGGDGKILLVKQKRFRNRPDNPCIKGNGGSKSITKSLHR